MRRLAATAVVALVTACAPGQVPPPTTVAPQVSPTTTTKAPPAPAVDAAAGLGDRMFPDLGNAGYDAISYDVALDIDSELTEVQGRTAMTAVAGVSLSSFVVDFSAGEVVSVTVDGTAATWERSGRDLRITPSSAPISAGAEFVVMIEHRGRIEPIQRTAFPFPTGWQIGDQSRYLFSQPDGASAVFPVNDHPSDRADVTLVITVPAPHSAVSGGRRLDPLEGDGPGVHRFEIREVAPYLVPLAVGPFESVVAADGTMIWIPVGDAVPAGFDRQAEILAALEADLGPYPFDSIGALIVDDDLPAALETQTLPTYTRVSAEWREPVIAHELAHQWFGNEIALGQWDDIWLNEGFATFMTWRWIERDRGRDAYEEEVGRAWQTVFSSRLPPPDHPPGQDLFNLSVYLRGGLTLAALRDFVGDERFFEFVRQYVAAFSDDVVTTERFLTFVLVVLGPDAEQLVIDWIRDPELPPNPLG
ncbi:MAG: M1 family metallopeptidase [Acidimicrobiia bacterium]|nr:M1 family metallopeptidase [Acidimicrobiia bacterium]